MLKLFMSASVSVSNHICLFHLPVVTVVGWPFPADSPDYGECPTNQHCCCCCASGLHNEGQPRVHLHGAGVHVCIYLQSCFQKTKCLVCAEILPLQHQLEKHQNDIQLEGINRHHKMYLAFINVQLALLYIHVSSTFTQYALGQGVKKRVLFVCLHKSTYMIGAVLQDYQGWRKQF